MKKKLAIIGGVAIGVIGLCVILCFTLFSLKTVEVDFRSSTTVLTGQEQTIIDSGEFSYGGCVLFLGKRTCIEKIEKAHPYVKVVNIETVFPSKYIIHCTERQEVYAIKGDNKTFICDEEFKVLTVAEGEYQPAADKPIEFVGLSISNQNAEVGDFLQVKNRVDVYSAFIENNRQLFEQRSLIKQIEVGKLYDDNIKIDQPYVKFSLYDGQTYIIKNSTYALKYKIAKMFAVQAEIFSLIGKPIDGDESNLWTAEKIKGSTIEINNYYLYEGHGENECYFRVIPPQEASNI